MGMGTHLFCLRQAPVAISNGQWMVVETFSNTEMYIYYIYITGYYVNLDVNYVISFFIPIRNRF